MIMDQLAMYTGYAVIVGGGLAVAAGGLGWVAIWAAKRVVLSKDLWIAAVHVMAKNRANRENSDDG